MTSACPPLQPCGLSGCGQSGAVGAGHKLSRSWCLRSIATASSSGSEDRQDPFVGFWNTAVGEEEAKNFPFLTGGEAVTWLRILSRHLSWNIENTCPHKKCRENRENMSSVPEIHAFLRLNSYVSIWRTTPGSNKLLHLSFFFLLTLVWIQFLLL